MKIDELEIRSVAEKILVNDEGIISGYAIVYDVESRILADFEGEFVEVIKPGAVDEALLSRSDIKALYNHNRDDLLARYTEGSGTLSLVPDEKGLFFSFSAPKTTLGDDVRELVKRGDLRGCSFAFTVNPADVEYHKRADGRPLRVIKKIASLHDISIVVDPAYIQTSVDVRSLSLACCRSVKSCQEFINDMLNFLKNEK